MENSTLIISFIFILQILEKENYYICKNNIYRIILSSCLIANKVNDEFHFKNSYFSKIGGLNLNEMNYLEYSFLNKMNFKLYINEGEFYFILDKIIRSVKAKNYCKIAEITGSVDTTLKYAFLALDFCNETDIELMACPSTCCSKSEMSS